MLASEVIMAKALEYDDFRLTKIATAIHGTDLDQELFVKLANPILTGLMAAGKTLLQNNTIRNAAVGAGVGAVSGAATAEKGERLSGALKGGAIGGVLAGVSTVGNNVAKGGLGIKEGLKAEGAALKSIGQQAKAALPVSPPAAAAVTPPPAANAAPAIPTGPAANGGAAPVTMNATPAPKPSLASQLNPAPGAASGGGNVTTFGATGTSAGAHAGGTGLRAGGVGVKSPVFGSPLAQNATHAPSLGATKPLSFDPSLANAAAKPNRITG